MLYFIFLIIILPTTVFAQTPCSNSLYTRYTNGRCYRNFTTPMKVYDAESTCLIDGAFLVSAHNAADRDAIALIASSLNDDPWLGLNCSSNTVCSWFDGTPYNYSNFAQGLANVILGNCAYFSLATNNWISTSCVSEFKIFICQLVETDTNSQCPPWYNLGSDGRCYYFEATPDTFDAAQSDCESKGGNLASIHSDQQDEILYKLSEQYDGSNGIWIGLTYKDAYLWTDNSNFDYQNWSDPFPNPRYGNCVKMSTDSTDSANLGKWKNSECINVFQYISQFGSGTTSSFPSPSTLSPPGFCPLNNLAYYSNQGTLSSPGYPLYYGNLTMDLLCDYHLNVPLEDAVSIRFTDWSLKAGDYIQLYDGDEQGTLIAMLNATVYVDPNHFYTTQRTNLMLVRFYSAAGNANVRGWVAPFTYTGSVTATTVLPTGFTRGYTYQPVPPNQCPQINYYNYGMIVSPGYPNSSYGPSLNCTYILQAYAGQMVQIIFGEIYTEACCDFIFVYDGPNLSSNKIAVIEGLQQSGTKMYTSTGQFMTIQFTSDSIVEYAGWSANFSSIACIGIGCSTVTTKPITTTASVLCDGWTQDPNKNQCYKYFSTGGNFFENHDSCRNIGGYLLSFHDVFQENFIIQLINTAQQNNPNFVWIGLHREANTNPWMWIDGSNVDYLDWGPGQPNGNADCVVIQTFDSKGWFVQNCSYSLPYICYRTY